MTELVSSAAVIWAVTYLSVTQSPTEEALRYHSDIIYLIRLLTFLGLWWTFNVTGFQIHGIVLQQAKFFTIQSIAGNWKWQV